MKRKMVWSMSALLAGAGLAAAQDVQVASGPMANPGAAVVQTGHWGSDGCGTGLCGGNAGCGVWQPKYYGSLEWVVWRLGNSFSESGRDTLPSIRAQMPFGVHSQSLIVNPDGSTATRNVTDTFGIATISPVLFSGSNLDSQDRSGVRLTVGTNFNDEWGAELTYFQLERKGASFTAGASNVVEGFSNGLNNLIVNADFSTTEEPTLFNPTVSAVIAGESRSRFFGVDGVIKHHAFTIGQTRFSELYGFRFLELDEDQTLTQVLSISDPVFVGAGNFVPGIPNITGLVGSYNARNQFYGFTIGGRIEGDWSRFYYNMTGKFSAGGVREELRTLESVASLQTDAAIPETLFPTQTDLHENRTRLAFVLEGGLNGGYRLTDSLSIYAGYNVIVVSKMARPTGGSDLPANGAGTISLDVGGTANRSATLTQFNEHRFVAQGVNLGLELRY